MKNHKIKIKIVIIYLLSFFFLLAMTLPVSADLISRKEPRLDLTELEEGYIKNKGVIIASSIDGGAPLHYRDSKGKITGIAVSILDEISRITGLNFE